MTRVLSRIGISHEPRASAASACPGPRTEHGYSGRRSSRRSGFGPPGANDVNLAQDGLALACILGRSQSGLESFHRFFALVAPIQLFSAFYHVPFPLEA